MADNELFKTTLMGGYDKDDVEKHIQKMKDEAYVNKNRLLQLLKQRDQTIQELTNKLDEKDGQLKQRDRDIKEKYQTYIDNYEQIGRLVYESRVRADQMIIDARDESRRIIQEARNLARRRLEQVQAQIDDKLDEGREKHQAIQKELESMLELLKEVRKRCLLSYDNVEDLVTSYTEQEDPFANIMTELEERFKNPEEVPGEEVSFQEQMQFMREQNNKAEGDEDGLDEADTLEEEERINSLRHVMEDESDPIGDISEIHVMSVEEVLRYIDEQQAAATAPDKEVSDGESESYSETQEDSGEDKINKELKDSQAEA